MKFDLKKFESAVVACNRCGFCTSYCPTYNATGNEKHSPRGRNQAFRALLEGKMKNPLDMKESIDTCLLCGECTSVCFSEVPTAELMVQARNYLNGIQDIPGGLRYVLENLLPYPKRLRRVLKIAFLGKKLGLSGLLRKTGLLGRISPTLAAADELVTSVSTKFLRDYKDIVPAAPITRASVKQERVAFMPVCGSQYVRPAVGLATLSLMKRLNVDVTIPEVMCCGLPAASYGVLDQVQRMARENVNQLERERFETIVVDDSSCGAHIKEYGKYLIGDSSWAAKAQSISQRTRELSSFLLQKGLKTHLAKARWTGGVVAYHDPCKAQYAQKVVNPPRDLMSGIPGLSLVPVKDADQCCGGGGTYSFVHPEMSQQVLAAKIKNIQETQCAIVVTSSVSCLIQLAYGLRKANSPIEALHLSEFLERALTKKK